MRKVNNGVIWLDTTFELSSSGELPIGESIKFYIGMMNNTGFSQRGISNGFRVYSPDGAEWTGTVGNVLPQ